MGVEDQAIGFAQIVVRTGRPKRQNSAYDALRSRDGDGAVWGFTKFCGCTGILAWGGVWCILKTSSGFQGKGCGLTSLGVVD